MPGIALLGGRVRDLQEAPIITAHSIACAVLCRAVLFLSTPHSYVSVSACARAFLGLVEGSSDPALRAHRSAARPLFSFSLTMPRLALDPLFLSEAARRCPRRGSRGPSVHEHGAWASVLPLCASRCPPLAPPRPPSRPGFSSRLPVHGLAARGRLGQGRLVRRSWSAGRSSLSR